MNHQKLLYAGISYAAWGYFFLYFDVKFGNVSILPAFVGALLFLSAINLLKEERRDMVLLRPFAIGLAIWNFGNWIASWFGTSLDEHFAIISLLVSIASMYFHFQLMTDFAALAHKYDGSNRSVESRLLEWRTIQTITQTFAVLMIYLKDWIPAHWRTVMIVFAIVYMIAGFCLMRALFSLRKVVNME